MDHTLDPLDLRLLHLLETDASRSNLAISRQVHASPATCLRRVARLRAMGVIKSVVAVLDPALVGSPLTCLIEVSLDRQDAEAMSAFEMAASKDPAVRQCYQMSAGVDFALVVYVADMDAYHLFAHRLLTAHSNVRNVRTLFSTRCAKFDTRRLTDQD